MYIVDVFVTNENFKVDHPFSYLSATAIPLYIRVLVPFRSRKNIGLVIRCEYTELTEQEIAMKAGFSFSFVQGMIDQKPLLNDELFALAEWMAKTTLSPLISCLNVMFPPQLKTRLNFHAPKTEERIHLSTFDIGGLSPKQRAYFDKLSEGMFASEARKISAHFFRFFHEKGWLSIFRREAKYRDEEFMIAQENFLALLPSQRKVLQAITEGEKPIHYLYGVTGSGKTEVYLHLARTILQKGRQVLILVPEISLTPQMISRVRQRFANVAFYHSELSAQERYEQYQRVAEGSAPIVVGTRSSVFLPFHNLGLIIIDEEHDQSYKQDNTPCYDAKRIAMKRILDSGGKLLMASATPSLESYTRALKGEYGFSVLPKRVNDCMPDIEIINLRDEVINGGNAYLSRRLEAEIEKRLSLRQQSIILLNRRGYAPVVRCGECSATLQCQDCDISLSFHQDESVLKCHQCGRIYKLPTVCPACKKPSLIMMGIGTKRIEEVLSHRFPDAKLARMDYDSTRLKGAREKILTRFEHNDIDILVGTQMIAKGLDYPNVTLVGILNGDAGLMHQDYNATKLSFDLLMQASGRSGRAGKPGKVLIQALDTDHYVLKAVLAQDYEQFYRTEMFYREKAAYPPYSHFCSFVLSDSVKERLESSMQILLRHTESISVYHYRPVNIGKRGGKERSRLLFRHKNLTELLEKMHILLKEYVSSGALSSLKVDVDPLYME